MFWCSIIVVMLHFGDEVVERWPCAGPYLNLLSHRIPGQLMEQYFAANDVAANAKSKWRAILLSSCGIVTYQLIRNLLALSKPAEAAIVKVVMTDYNLNPSQIVEQCKFNSRIH